MRDTEERVRAARLGGKRIRERRRLHAVSAGTALLSLCLVLLLTFTLPPSVEAGASTSVTTEFSASVFANPQSLSYIMIVLLSFALGVSVTVLCVLLRRRGGEQEDDD